MPLPFLLQIHFSELNPPGLTCGSPESQRKVCEHNNCITANCRICAERRQDLTEIEATLARHSARLREVDSQLIQLRFAMIRADSKLEALGWAVDKITSTVSEQGSKLDELLSLLRSRGAGPMPGA